jgi:sulfotransferase family protein
VNPYVFIVGCPRSGTTLLHRLADAHPLLAIVHETLWIPSFYERRVGLTPEGRVTPELLPRLVEHRRFKHLEIAPEEVERMLATDEPIPYARFVTALLDRFGAARGKPLVGDKSPGYVRNMPVLHELFPHARFVHLIRDGRDVCLSAVNWRKADRVLGRYHTWQRDPITTAALWWERCVRLGRESGRALGPELYTEVRYEDVVADPEGECRRLCDFLRLEFDAAMLRFHEGRTRALPGLSTKRRWLPPTAGLRDWRTEMDAADVDRFEAVAGELLEELGYGRGAPHPDPFIVARSAHVRRRFGAEITARRRPLPERWG